MTIKPLNNFIFLKQKSGDVKTKSGILLSQKEFDIEKTEVLYSGAESTFKPGDNVLIKYSVYNFNEFQLDGEKFLVGQESDILAKVE